MAAFVALVHPVAEGGAGARRENLPFHLLRAVLGTIGILCNFYAVDHLVLSNASILNKMSPLFCADLLLPVPEGKTDSFPDQRLCSGLCREPVCGEAHSVQSWIWGPLLSACAVELLLHGAYTMVRILGLRGERSSVIVCF